MDGEHAFFREKHVARWFAALMCAQAAVIALIGLLVAATGPVSAVGLPFGPKWEGPGAWRYIPPGVGEGVRVRWMEGQRKRTALIGARDAAALAAAIERARAGASAGGLRVGDVDAAEEEALAEAEGDAEAAAEVAAEDEPRVRPRAR